MLNIILNFLLTTIYGNAILAGVIFILANKVLRLSDNFSFSLGFATFFISLFFLSTVPLMFFKGKVDNRLEELPAFAKIIYENKVQDVFMPLTLFYSFSDQYIVTSPSPSIGASENEYLQWLLEQDGLEIHTSARFVEAHCEKNELGIPPKWSTAAGESFYAITNKRKMRDYEYDAYCTLNWDSEREIMRQEILEGFNKKS